MNPTGFADQVASVSLPPGWAWARLADIARINPALDIRITDDAREVTFVPMAAVDEGFGGVQRPQTRTFGQVKKGYTPFQVHDVIMAKITPCMENGKGGVVRGREDEVFFGSTEFHVLRARAGVLPEWIGSFLAQERIRRAARLGMKGSAGQLRVPEEFLERLYFPLPPSAEQQRIADRIDELFTDLAAGVAALERVKRNLSRYRATVLHAAVTGRLVSSCAPDWADESRWQPLGGLIGDVEQGWSPKCERDAAIRDSDWAVMTTTAIQKMAFDSAENKRLPDTLEPTPQYEVHVGDMLVTRAGPRSRCGIACLVRKCRPRLILCDKAYRFRCIDSKALPEYLELALNARPITDAIERMKTGSSDSGLNLTQTRFRSLMVPLPPLPVQSAIVEAVNEKLSQIDGLEAEVGRGLARASRLRQSILKAAFEGKLVPQDPADEPASVLLERIHTAADVADTPRKGRRTRGSSAMTNGVPS